MGRPTALASCSLAIAIGSALGWATGDLRAPFTGLAVAGVTVGLCLWGYFARTWWSVAWVAAMAVIFGLAAVNFEFGAVDFELDEADKWENCDPSCGIPVGWVIVAGAVSAGLLSAVGVVFGRLAEGRRRRA